MFSHRVTGSSSRRNTESHGHPWAPRWSRKSAVSLEVAGPESPGLTCTRARVCSPQPRSHPPLTLPHPHSNQVPPKLLTKALPVRHDPGACVAYSLLPCPSARAVPVPTRTWARTPHSARTVGLTCCRAGTRGRRGTDSSSGGIGEVELLTGRGLGAQGSWRIRQGSLHSHRR